MPGTFYYFQVDKDRQPVLKWTLASSGELAIKQSKTRRLPLVATIRYENVKVDGDDDAVAAPIALTQPCMWDALDEGSPGFLAFTDLLKEASEQRAVCYHLLLSVPAAFLLKEQKDVYKVPDNVVINAPGEGRDQQVNDIDPRTRIACTIGYTALNVLDAPASIVEDNTATATNTLTDRVANLSIDDD